MPRYSVSIVTFPVMFYVFFGVVLKNGPLNGIGPSVYVLCTMAAFGVMFAALMGLGVGIAAERGFGWLEVKRASPMPPAGWFIAKLVSALMFSSIIVTILFTLAVTMGGARMPVQQWAELGGALVGGALPFCALGFFLGYLITPNSAPAMINLVAMPMAFCSGLWVPLQFLPHPMARIAQVAAGISSIRIDAGHRRCDRTRQHRLAYSGAGCHHGCLCCIGMAGVAPRRKPSSCGVTSRR